MENFDEHKNKPPYLNSPRSLDACKRQGIDPYELLYLSLDAFKDTLQEKNVDKQLLKLLWEHNEEKRKEKLRVVTEERLRIIDEEKQGMWAPTKSVQQASGMLPPGKSTGSAGNSSMGKAASGVVVTDSAMLDRERKQLEKIKLKQQQEIQQMMEYELKMQAIREQNEEKLRKQQEREAQRLAELAQRQKEQEETRRQKELEKKLKADEEAERQKQKQKELYEREMQKAEEEKLKEKKRQQEIRLREEEQKKKQEEFKQKTEEILKEQQRLVEQKKQEMEQRDLERKMTLEQKQRERALAAEQKRRETEGKLVQTKQKMESLLEEQRMVPSFFAGQQKKTHNRCTMRKREQLRRSDGSLKRRGRNGIGKHSDGPKKKPKKLNVSRLDSTLLEESDRTKKILVGREC